MGIAPFTTPYYNTCYRSFPSYSKSPRLTFNIVKMKSFLLLSLLYAVARSRTALASFITASTQRAQRTSCFIPRQQRQWQRSRTQHLNMAAATPGGPLGKPSYTDDTFFKWHMETQRQKIRDYVCLDTYVDTDKLWNLAWHDSFVRNGLSDFVPPLTDTLNVLVVGENNMDPDTLLSSESTTVVTTSTSTSAPDAQVTGDVSAATTTSSSTDSAVATAASDSEFDTLVDMEDVQDQDEEDDDFGVIIDVVDREDQQESQSQSSSITAPDNKPLQDSSCSFLSAILNENIDDETANNSALGFATYDCIMDRGVMATLQSSLDQQGGDQDTTTAKYGYNEDISRLLLEVTKRIREHGVYVMQTNGPLSTKSKDYLLRMGDLLGLQWQFELDGISDDNICVNVARKYFKEELPTIGKLAKL